MRTTVTTATFFDVVDAPAPSDPSQTITLGVRRSTIRGFGMAGWITPLAQFYGIVQEGLIVAEHAFRGLNRPMRYEENMEADQSIVVYAWAARNDYEWLGPPYSNGEPTPKPALPGRIFVVLVREESTKEEENGKQIMGTIEKWNWVREDGELRGAPIDWKVRYAKKLWSRSIP